MKKHPDLIYKCLHEKYGDQNWWPIDYKYHEKNFSDPNFEIIIGAILTQNTSWLNVEKSLMNIKNNKKLDIKKINNTEIKDLKKLIKPSGFYNKKAEIIKNITYYIVNKYDSSINLFLNNDLNKIRKELLLLKGIGPETADSILLYAGNKPTFVVDAYTRRICNRIPIEINDSYIEIKKKFEVSLRKKYSNEKIIRVYKEFHALIVLLCKSYCKKIPKCQKCIIKKYCNFKKLGQ